MSFEFPDIRPWLATRHCRILSYASFVPPRQATNQELIERHGLKVMAPIVKRTLGVESRHVADPGMSDSDMLAVAAKECLARAGIGVDDLSKLVVNKFLGDRLLPPTASILQRKLGASVAFPCMDIDGGSNGFLQALEMAAKCVNAGDDHVLIASGGVCHDLVDHTDPRTAFLFGDGAAAILIGPSDDRHVLASYGFSNHAFIELQAGVRFMDLVSIPFDAPDAELRARNLYSMGNWKDAQEFILQAARTTVDRILRTAGIAFADVDRFLVSESVGPLRDAIVSHLGIPADKTLSLFATHANTMSASLPLLHCAAESRHPSPPGSLTLFLSFGEGISGGGLLYKH